MKNSYGCILVKPQLGENIGATARVLKNFGLNKVLGLENILGFSYLGFFFNVFKGYTRVFKIVHLA